MIAVPRACFAALALTVPEVSHIAIYSFLLLHVHQLGAIAQAFECCIVLSFHPRRHIEVTNHFPSAMGVDDFMARLEMALAAYGFTGDNAIGECLRSPRNLQLRTCQQIQQL